MPGSIATIRQPVWTEPLRHVMPSLLLARAPRGGLVLLLQLLVTQKDVPKLIESACTAPYKATTIATATSGMIMRTGIVFVLFAAVERGDLCVLKQKPQQTVGIIADTHRLPPFHGECNGMETGVGVGNQVLKSFLCYDVILCLGGRGLSGESDWSGSIFGGGGR